QEELGHPELRIAAHVLVDLLDRAEEGAPHAAPRRVVRVELSAADDLEPRRVAARALGLFAQGLDERRDAIEGHVATVEAVTERHRAPDRGHPVSTDDDRGMRRL